MGLSSGCRRRFVGQRLGRRVDRAHVHADRLSGPSSPWRWCTLNESVAVRTWCPSSPVQIRLGASGGLGVRRISETARPAERAGAGLALAMVLQASFYLGFFTGLGLGFWSWSSSPLAASVARPRPGHSRLCSPSRRRDLFCLPVLSNYSPIVGSDQYFHRYWAETWIFGSENCGSMWCPRIRGWATIIFATCGTSAAPDHGRGLEFPRLHGCVHASRSRRWRWLRQSEMSRKFHPFVWVSLGLMAFWTILSLAGGPSALIFHAIPSFRCYGRAGLLVVALGSVVAPIVVVRAGQIVAAGSRRVIVTLGLVALVASDAGRAAATFEGWPAESKTARVGRLAGPTAGRDSQLAVFMPTRRSPRHSGRRTADNKPFYWWGIYSLEWLLAASARGVDAEATFTLFEGRPAALWVLRMIRSIPRGCVTWPRSVIRRLRSIAITWRPTRRSPRWPGST